MSTRALASLELRLLLRYGAVALIGVLAAAWTAGLLVLPAGTARQLAPWVLLLDTALLGTTVVGALGLLERDLGMRAALAATPTRLAGRLVVRVAAVVTLVTASAVPIALAGRPSGPGGLILALLAVGLVAVLGVLVAVAVAAHRQSVITFLVALPLLLLPLLLPALAHGAGLRHPALYAVPTTGAVDLIRFGYAAPGAPGPGWGAVWSVGWLILASAVAGVVARDRLRRSGDPPQPLRAGPGPAGRTEHRSRWWGKDPVRSFLHTDLVRVRRDPLLLLIGGSPLLVGLALRFGYPPVHSWLLSTSGLDLDPYRPVLLALAVLLHVPVTLGMVGALMVLDDLDDRALTALRTSPLTLLRYLGYRAGLVTVAAWAGLLVAVPLSGMAVDGWPAVLAAGVPAGLVAPLFMLATLARSRNKVEGVAVVKLLGLPVYAPVVAWWVTGPAGWLLALLPTWWVLQALWTSWWYAVPATGLLAIATALLLVRQSRVESSG